jgi:hypothetical protein
VDRPRRPDRPSARATDGPLLKLELSANWLQRKPKIKPDQTETKQEHEEHRDELGWRGLSAWSSQTIREVQTEQKTHDPESQLPQIIIGFPKR